MVSPTNSMRVTVDEGSIHTYKMGKNRKHRIRKNKENEAEESSDDGATICSHITKAINFAAMRKAMLKTTCTFGECSTCALEATKSGAKDLFGSPLEGAAASVTEDSDHEPTIWVCLQCGHQGCDRNSREKHALKHFETPHSGIHCIVANLTTWAVWCYNCDNDIPVDTSKRVLECVDFLRKQAGLSRIEISHFPGQRGLPASQSDVSPTDPSPPTTQSRPDKTQGPGKSSAVACQKVKGLSNLGNTCFFNAVMQNLCQTHSLESMLMGVCKQGRTMGAGGWREGHSDSESSGDDEEHKELSQIEISPGEAGPLTASLLNFVQEMNNGSTHSTVTPNALFTHVCKKAPRFKGFQQQDSHELLRYLVDVVRNEEIKRAQSGILKYFKLPETINPKKVDEDTKTKIKEYGRQVKFTFLDSLFGGQLVSMVTCEECKHISQIVEPFLDLSLPVTEEKPQRPNQAQGGRRKDSFSATSATAAEAAAEDAGPLMGIDGFAERRDQPSKYMQKKNKKQARRDAKKKGRPATIKGSSRSGTDKTLDGEGEEKEGGEEEGVAGPKGDQDLDSLVGSSGNQGGDEDGHSSQQDDSDADVEDNLESETSRLQQAAGDNNNNNNESNLPQTTPNRHSKPTSSSNLCSNISNNNNNESDGDASSATDQSIKTCTLKENHIVPTAEDLSQSGDSQPASLDSLGIKEEENREVEKLSNGVSNMELNCATAQWERTNGGAGGGGGMPNKPSSPKLEIVDAVVVSDAGCKFEVGETVVNNHCDAVVRLGNGVPASPVGDAGSGGGGGCGATGVEKDLEEKLTLADCDAGGSVFSPVANGDKNAPLPNNHIAGKSAKEFRRDARYRSKATLAPRYHPSSKECSVMSCLHQFTAAELLCGSNKVSCKMCTRMRPKNATSNKDKKGPDTVYSNAAKQFLIMIPPAVLTLHLKRFEQVGYTSRKVNRHVDFPLLLDLAPYCSALCQDVGAGQRRVLYALYGVVEHSGRLQTGHYTAYVKVRPSLGPLTSFLHPHPPNPMDYINRYMDHVQNGPVSASAEEESADASVDTLVPPGRWFHISDSRINEVTEATVLKAQAYLLFYERLY